MRCRLRHFFGEKNFAALHARPRRPTTSSRPLHAVQSLPRTPSRRQRASSVSRSAGRRVGDRNFWSDCRCYLINRRLVRCPHDPCGSGVYNCWGYKCAAMRALTAPAPSFKFPYQTHQIPCIWCTYRSVSCASRRPPNLPQAVRFALV